MMEPIAIDLSEVTEGVPPGEWRAVASDAETKISKAGNQYIKWRFTVVGAADPKFNGQVIFHNTMLTGKAAFRLTQLYRAATKEKLDSKATSIDPNKILGKEVLLTVVTTLDEHGSPTEYTEVKAVRPVA